MGYKKKCADCDGLEIRGRIAGKALQIVQEYQAEIALKKNTPIKNINKIRVIELLLCSLPKLNIQKVGETGIVISK